MRFSVSDLNAGVRGVMRACQDAPVVITHHNRPAAILVYVDEANLDENGGVPIAETLESWAAAVRAAS